jgi:para-nitrobenzyl esterase
MPASTRWPRRRSGTLAADFVAAYRADFPDAGPTELATRFVTRPRDVVGEHRLGRAQGSRAPVYTYRFDYETPALGGVLGATHGGDIPFALNDFASTPMAGDRPENESFGRFVSEAFVRSAHSGDPNHPGLPEWRPYTTQDRCTMILDTVPRAEVDPHPALRRLYQRSRGGSTDG